jgi:hypothetical protein
MCISAGWRDLLQILRLREELLLRHRHESPVALPDAVVEIPQHVTLRVEAAQVHRPQRGGRLLAQTLGDAIDAPQIDRLGGHVQREQVLRLAQAEPLEPLRIVRRVVVHLDDRRPLVAVDQQAAAVVRRHVHGAAQMRRPALLAPVGRVREQPLGRRFVRCLEVSEEPDAVAVELVVQAIAARADAADAAIAGERPRTCRPSACWKNGLFRGSTCQASALVTGGT